MDGAEWWIESGRRTIRALAILEGISSRSTLRRALSVGYQIDDTCWRWFRVPRLAGQAHVVKKVAAEPIPPLAAGDTIATQLQADAEAHCKATVTSRQIVSSTDGSHPESPNLLQTTEYYKSVADERFTGFAKH